jgi:carotenoid cleavage dioxygenase
VVLDLPVVYRHAAALVGARFPYTWQPGRPARIGLLPRRPGPSDDTAGPRWFPIEPCYVFDTVNAYDEDGGVVLDAVWHARAFDDPGRDAARPSHVRRWRLDLDTGEVTTRMIPQAGETAVVDERVGGHRHRYLFGVAGARTCGAELRRHDLATGTTLVRGLGGGPVGRPVFAPDPGRAVEGAGWIVLLAEDAAGRRGDLLVFDALDLAGPPRAVVRLPHGLPVTRHATWLRHRHTRAPERARGRPSSSPAPAGGE